MNKFVKQNLIIFLIFGIMLFSGCTEMTRTEKTLCYNLTSKSFAYIPYCETENSCFDKVNELFNTNLGYEQESELYKLKNSLARSWFFYNKAMNEIKKAPKYCLEGDSANLAPTINQTSQYLDYSFTELDKSLKKSFEIILTQEKILDSEKIELVPEEPLFDSLIELKQINSDIESGKTNSGSYYSYYLTKIEEFNSLGLRKGFNELIEEDSIYIKFSKYLTKEIFEKYEIKEIKLPLISINYSSIQNIFENLLYSEQSLKQLQKFPLYEFTSLYSSVAGNNNSAIKRFADTINKVSNNKKIVETNLKNTWKNIEIEKNKLDTLKKNISDFEKYDLIRKELLPQTISGEKNTKELIDLIEIEYQKLKNEKNSSKITLGEELKKSKNIYSNLLQLNEKLNIQNESEIKKIENACETKAAELLKIDNFPKELELLYNELNFYAKKTNSINGEEKIYYCKEMINLNKELIIGINNYKQFESEKTEFTKNCFEELEKIFKEINLFELEQRFENLKKEKFDKSNLIYFENACSSILNQVKQELKDEITVNKILEEYKQTIILQEKIGVLKININKDLINLDKKSKSYDTYFKTENMFELYIIRFELLEKLKKLNTTLNQEIEEILIDYFKNNFTLTALTKDIPKTGMDNNYIERLTLNNFFYELYTPFSIEIPKKMTLIENSPQIRNIIYGESTLIFFDYLTKGINTFDFSSSEKIELIETKKIIYATNEKSLIQKNLKLNSNTNYAKLFISTKKISDEFVVIIEENEISPTLENEIINFYGENINKKSNINIYFYLKNLLNSQISKLSETTINGETEVNYLLKIKNSFEDNIEGTIIVPIFINDFVNEIQVIDATKIKKTYEIIDNKIVIKNISFFPKEEKEFLIKIKISNKIEYYTEILEKLYKELILYGETKISAEILNNLENISLSSEKKIEELIKNGENELEKINENLDNQKNLYLIKENLQNEIKKYEDKIKELEELGLFEEKESLLQKINLSKTLLESNLKNDILKGINILQNEPTSISENIKKEVEELHKIIKNDIGKDEFKQKLANTFLIKKEEFDKWKEIDIEKSKNLFLELKEAYLNYFDDKNIFIEQPNFSKNEEFEKLVKESRELILFLENELSFDEQELINGKFIQPLTLARLKKLKLDLSEIENSKNYVENYNKLIEIRGELKSAADSIKKQTALLFNKSIDENVNSQLLEKAKNYIDSNKFVAAFLTLSNLKSKETEIPFLGLIPIFGIILIAFFIKQKLSKQEKKSQTNKQIILEEWDK